jgi:Zn ribbon nucleic-acid-binding protein
MKELFSDIGFDGSPDSLHRCMVKLQKDDETRSSFESKYVKAEDLYESLMPNETLGMENNRERYEILSEIYYKYQGLEEGSDPDNLSISEDQVRNKTREILEKHVNVEGSGESEDIEYEIDEPEVRRVKDYSPEYEAGLKGPGTVDDIDPLAKKNPAYAKLSERVKDVLESWREDSIESKEAVKEYDSAQEKKEELKSEKEQRGMSDSEFAVFKLLTLGYDVEEEEAEKISTDIEERIKDTEIGVNYRQAKNEIRREIIYSLKQEERIDLAKTDFLEKSVDYIFENKKNA